MSVASVLGTLQKLLCENVSQYKEVPRGRRPGPRCYCRWSQLFIACRVSQCLVHSCTYIARGQVLRLISVNTWYTVSLLFAVCTTVKALSVIISRQWCYNTSTLACVCVMSNDAVMVSLFYDHNWQDNSKIRLGLHMFMCKFMFTYFMCKL